MARRVVLVINGLTVGGAETQLVHLAHALRDRGHAVWVLAILRSFAFATELAALGVPVHVIDPPPPRGLMALARTVRALRRWQPDVVVSFLYQANVLARLASALAGVPVAVSSIRNERFGGRRRELLLRLTDPLATVTTTNSALAASALLRRRVVAPGRLRVIPNGVDPSAFTCPSGPRERLRAALGETEGRFVWLAAGRLEPQKDYATLLHAVARGAADGSTAALWIAGQGRERAALEALAAELGLGDRVRLLGLRHDVPGLLAAADALVLSSAWEGLPNVVLQAMAARRPVVATAVGGIPELVREGVTGLLAPPRRPVVLAAAMRTVEHLPEADRRTMGEHAHGFVANRFALPTVQAEWMELLDELLTDGPTRQFVPAGQP